MGEKVGLQSTTSPMLENESTIVRGRQVPSLKFQVPGDPTLQLDLFNDLKSGACAFTRRVKKVYLSSCARCSQFFCSPYHVPKFYLNPGTSPLKAVSTP